MAGQYTISPPLFPTFLIYADCPPGSAVALAARDVYLGKAVTLRDLHQNAAFIAGMILMALGAVNSIIGMSETNKYQRVIANAVVTGLEENYRNFRELSQQQNRQVLSRINEDEANYNIARVRLDFFHVVFTGGQVLFLIGVVTVSYALIRIIRRDSSRRIQKIASKQDQARAQKASAMLRQNR